MSTTRMRDPFEVADVELELAFDPLADDPGAPRLETWVGRGLLLVAVLLVLVVDLRIAKAAPTYQAGNEAVNVAYLEQIAQHLTPPVLGKDSFVVDAKGPLRPRTVDVRGLERPVKNAPPLVLANVSYPQNMAFERPTAYYLSAPIAWLVPWHDRVLMLRLLTVLLTCLAVAFLWLAMREVWPANPLAAGLAAIVLACMGGLISGFALYQPEALLLALWCAGLWLAVRDGRHRACSWTTVAVWAAATCMSNLVVPAAVAVVVYLAVRAEGRAAFARRLPLYLAAVLASTVVWVIWNLHSYGDAWPLNTVAGGSDRTRNWHQLRAVLDQVYGVNRQIFDGSYIAGIPPVTRWAMAPAPLLATLVAFGLMYSLFSGSIAFARRPLARIGSLLVASFASAYLTLFVSSVVAGTQVDFNVNHFGGYVAAWAGVVGVGVTVPFVGHRRLGLVAVSLLTLVLAVVMLRTPVA